MNVRYAQTSDLPVIVPMMVKLLDHLRQVNPELQYAQDRDKLAGGALEMLRGKMVTEGHVVMVVEQTGNVRGFCVGCLMSLPSFMEHTLVGSCEWMYPMEKGIIRPLLRAFDTWAAHNGATGRQGYTPDGSFSEKAMRHDKMVPQFTTFFKEYKE